MQPQIESVTTDPFEKIVSLSWKPIKPEDTKGNLLGYTIECRALNQDLKQTLVSNATATNVTISNLTTATTYIITVAGFTRKGLGPSSNEYVTCKLNFEKKIERNVLLAKSRLRVRLHSLLVLYMDAI